MSEIVQKLGFDAGQAIQELTRLDSTMQRFESRLGQSAQAFGAFNKAGVGIKRTGNAFRSEVPAMVAQTERLTVSLGLLSRVIFTQAIVRGLSQMRRGFESVARTASDFQKQVALIQTIDDSGQSFEQLSAAIQETSDALNVPLIETAAALYQTISNQIGDAAQSQEFLNDALRFAKATNSDAASSVDLLSGVLKSFNLNVSETDRVASVMFKTIDLGRIEANELANSFGRLGSISKDTGLSLEEVAGALSATQSVDSVAGKQFFLDDVQQLQQAFQLLQQLQAAQTQATVDPNLTTHLSRLEAVLAANPAGQFGGATQAMNAAVGPSQAIAAAWERAAAAAQRAAAAAASAPRNQSFGGSMFLASGGFARGIDTIPAMLSPGEFVVNARSARNFAAQLQAINAGQTPAFRENGGTVNDNSTTIGDVHLHSNSANVKELMKDMQRLQRRGIARLD